MVIRINSNPYGDDHGQRYAEMVGSRSHLDLHTCPTVADWGMRLIAQCRTENCTKVPLNPCESHRRLFSTKDLDLSSLRSPPLIDVSNFSNLDVAATAWEAIPTSKCALGSLCYGNDPNFQSAHAKLMRRLDVAPGSIRLISIHMANRIVELCMHATSLYKDECFRHVAISVGGMYAIIMALHLCTETHLYGFHLAKVWSRDGENTKLAYNYYQPVEVGKPCWEHPTHLFHDYNFMQFLVDWLVDAQYVKLHL